MILHLCLSSVCPLLAMALVGERVVRKWYPENSARVHGVVYLGSGTRIGDALAGAGVPAMLVTGSRDPFTPPEVRSDSVGRVVRFFD